MKEHFSAEFGDLQKQIDYYKNIAVEAGNKRLRDIEGLSRLISRLRETEKALKKSKDELEKRVRERTEELSGANSRLEKEIQEKKRALEELHESEVKYRKLFEDSQEAMSLSVKGKIVDVNPSWLQLHGYQSKNEVIGKDVSALIHQDDVHILLERRNKWPHVALKKYPIRDYKKDGTVIDVEVYSSQVSFNGQDGMLATVRDISAIKDAEEKRLLLEEKLRQSEKMEAMGQLAGGVAHDLNNILCGIVSYPELILMNLPEGSPLAESILTIQRSGQRAAAIVQDLLTLARRGVHVMKSINLNNVITSHLNSPEHKKMISFHNGIVIKTELQNNLLNINGSPVHISKTVMNLISNALEAMPGGGMIYISTKNHFIEESVVDDHTIHQGEYVLLTISDTGTGLSETDKKRIFEPFYTKKIMNRSGTGLGMSVVWGTIKDHNGFIEIESRKNKGTTFRIFFPATREKTEIVKEITSLEDIQGKGEKILVVDDMEQQRIIASGFLKLLGYTAGVVSSGEEAVDYVKKNRPDLLLLDMIMEPGIDGLETYKRILALYPCQKAILISGFSETDNVREALRLGAGTYIKKPYMLRTLGLAIKKELEKS